MDAALPGNGERILRYIVGLGRDPSELLHVVLTHGHPDHTGTIPFLTRRAGMTVLAHAGDAKVQRDGGLRVYYPGQLLSLPWNLPFLGRIPVHQLLEEGQTLPTMGGLRVLHTPGHTPGSIALYLEERGVLFSGDMLLSDGRVFFRPFPFPGTNFRAYRSSVERLARLEFGVACVGHGRPLVGGAVAKAREMLENYNRAAPG